MDEDVEMYSIKQWKKRGGLGKIYEREYALEDDITDTVEDIKEDRASN